MTELTELSERVAQACRVLGRLDLTEAATGHVSARIPGTDRIVIRARGPDELWKESQDEDRNFWIEDVRHEALNKMGSRAAAA